MGSLSLLNMLPSCLAVLVAIYRPPEYSAHFVDFVKLLSVLCIDFNCVVIVGALSLCQ